MFDMSTEVDGIADFITCLSGLEISNSQLFKILSEKSVLTSIIPKLARISKDNIKHSKILEDISQQIGNSKIKTKECKIRLAIISKNIGDIIKQIKGKKEVTNDDLTEYLKVLEGSGGASQYLLVQAETFLLMADEINGIYGMDSKKYSDKLKGIIKDIEEHVRLLQEIKNTIENEETKNKMKHPSVKYQTPDAWYVPTHSQKEGHVI